MRLRLLIVLSALGIAMPCDLFADDNAGPVKVFLLAGQSNMQGAGQIKMNPNRNEGKGSLEYLVRNEKSKKQFAHTIDENGKWVVRDDVSIWYLGRKGGLSVGYGARPTAIGPEFQFGHVMGDHFQEHVLIIKTAWGGKTLAGDFRPPSSGGETGSYYKEMLDHVRNVLRNLDKEFPKLAGRRYEIVGLGWHQGWNDGLKMDWVKEYEGNLANLIRDLRKDLHAESMRTVIAVSGFGGRKQKIDRRLGIIAAQHGVAKQKEFQETVASVETRDFFRPPEESPSRQGYHWNSNAETYFLIGDGMAKAMIRLLGAK